MTPFGVVRWFLRLLAGVLIAVVVAVLYVAGHIWWVARHDDHPRSDAIVVLGASQYNGRPSPVFAARLDHALTLYKEHVAPRIITVGGKAPGDTYTEGGSGETYLAAHGVPSSALISVPTGRDTLSSLRAVKTRFAVGNWRTAVLVTDPWHCLRARTMARHLGIEAYTSPERTGPAVSSRGTEFHYVFRETEAYIYYRIFHDDNEHSAGAI